MSVEHADLLCDSCQRVTEHELHYVGRLLESARCSRCGTHMEVTHRALLPAYVQDLEQRVVSKPRRMWRRVTRDPLGYARSLPAAVLRQPVKFLREFWAVLRR